MSNLTEHSPKEPQKMRMVINGGNHEVDSATVPIQFFFSPDVVEQMTNESYIVIVDLSHFPQSGGEGSHSLFNECDLHAPRSLHKVSKGVKFLQIPKPGLHHIVALLFCGEGAYAMALSFIAHEDGCYANSISWSGRLTDMKFHIYNLTLHVRAAAMNDIQIPKELFASAPENALGKAFWKYINLWHHGRPTDECAYRNRMLLAVPKLAPAAIVYGIMYAVKSIWAGITAFLCLLAFFVGFKTNNVWDVMKKAFGFRMGIRDFFSLQFLDNPKVPYRLWKKGGLLTGRHDDLRMPITCLELTLFLFPLLPWILMEGREGFFHDYKSLFLKGPVLMIFTFIPCCVMITLFLKRTTNWFFRQPIWKRIENWMYDREAKQAEQARLPKSGPTQFITLIKEYLKRITTKVGNILARPFIWIGTAWDKKIPALNQAAEDWVIAQNKARRERSRQSVVDKQEAFQGWVRTNFLVTNMPKRVEIASIPSPPKVEERFVQKLYVNFWRLKGKICRPFAR